MRCRSSHWHCLSITSFHHAWIRLVSIRNSRIAFHRMAYGTRRSHLQHKPGASDTFGAWLRRWRKRENLSQSEAALRLRISKRTLQEWEQGRAAPQGLSRSAVEQILGA